MPLMIRTQISLREDQMVRLRDAAARRNVSLAAIIREAVDDVLAGDAKDLPRRWDVAFEAIGAHRAEGPNRGGSGRDHDAMLAEASAKRPPSRTRPAHGA